MPAGADVTAPPSDTSTDNSPVDGTSGVVLGAAVAGDGAGVGCGVAVAVVAADVAGVATGNGVNVADTLIVAASTVTAQSSTPEHAPDQPLNS